jgi:hypothetical protein
MVLGGIWEKNAGKNRDEVDSIKIMNHWDIRRSRLRVTGYKIENGV